MVKWLNNVTGTRGKSLVPSTIITIVIVAMLIISGPAQAVAVNIAGLEDSYTKGNDIEFQVKIDINDPDQYVSITNISLDLTGPVNKTIFFALDGKQISGDCKIKIKPVSIPRDDFGYGNSYGYDSRAGYGYDFGYGYGYGYNYGSGGEKISFIYNVTIDTDKKCFAAGDYSVVASLNTGKNVAFQSPAFGFRLLPVAAGDKIKAKVDIKPETINLESKGKFTAFITLPEDLDVRDIDIGTVLIEGAHVVNSSISNENGGTLIAKFNIQDLENVPTGNSVLFNVTGKVNGMSFEGNDRVKVIDNKDEKDVEECKCDDQVKDHEDECDDQVKDHDHEDECDDQVKDHDHEDECDDQVKENDHEDKKQKDDSSERYKKEDTKINNNGRGNNAVINNININDNTGTVNVNIYNQGGDGGNYRKNQDSQGNSKTKGNNGNGKSQSNRKGNE
ncbi:MAG: hypothetical protein WA144_09780 [Candidatus Methanoperedens sp.]